MKNHLLILAVLFLAIACRENKKPEQALPEGQSFQKPVVYTSNYPLYYFTGRVAGNLVDIQFPMKSSEWPSKWTPTAEVVTAMQAADLVFLNGATYETWLMNVSLPDSILVDTSIGFATRLLPSGETFTHSHGEEGAHSHEGVATHTWMDLSMAIAQARVVKDALVQSMPENREQFESNFRDLVADLGDLDARFKELQATGLPEVLYTQPFYPYFQKAYGLSGSVVLVDTNEDPTIKTLHDVEHLKAEKNIEYAVWPKIPSENTAGALKAHGLSPLILDPAESTPGEGDFITVWEKNLAILSSISAD